MSYGYINVGHAADCNKDRLERMLQDYDNQLYIKWHPTRNKGRGCWQIRRKPNHKSLVYHGEFNGLPLATAEYVEQDVICHVLDVPVLHYGILGRIREMDTWGHKDFGKFVDDVGRDYDTKVERKLKEDLTYSLKQEKRAMRDLAQAVKSGQSLGRILGKFGS